VLKKISMGQIKKAAKDFYRKILAFSLKEQVSEIKAGCFRLILGKRLRILWFLACLPFSRKNKRKVKRLFAVFEEQGIMYRHLARVDNIFDLANFQILSGYLQSGTELKASLAGFLHEKAINPKEAVRKQPGIPVQFRDEDSAIKITVLLFRLKKNNVFAAEKEISARLSFGDNLKRKLFYCLDENKSSASNSPDNNNKPVKVEALSEAFIKMCDDPAISEDTLILVNISGVSEISNQLAEISGSDVSGAELVVLRPNSILHQPAEMRKPERASNFAVTKSLLSKVIHFSYAEHPVTLLLGLWLLASQTGKVRVIDYEPCWPIEDNLQQSLPAETVQIDRLTTRITSEVLLRRDSQTFSGLVHDLPYYKKSLPLSTEQEEKNVNFSGILPEHDSFDVLLVTDFRIRGGGVKSVLEEAKVIKEQGLRIAVMHLDAITLHQQKVAFTPDVFSELSNFNIPLANCLSHLKADLTIVRYPPVLVALPEGLPVIDTEQAVIVVNQPPKRMLSDQGFYNPEVSDQNAKKLFSVEPKWWPNGPAARKAIEEYSERLNLSDWNWLNVVSSFADDAAIETRVSRMKDWGRSVSIGRHTRDVESKWPSTARAILQCYPSDDMFSVKILGGARWPRKLLKTIPPNWQVWNYGEIDVQDYLESLDFFVFFPHDERIEPFARCILEAMAAGVPVLLPNEFREDYGQSPIYCKIDDVTAVINDFKQDINKYKEKCFETRREAMEVFGPENLLGRLRNLGLKI